MKSTDKQILDFEVHSRKINAGEVLTISYGEMSNSGE
jgi:hypothetical protein